MKEKEGEQGGEQRNRLGVTAGQYGRMRPDGVLRSIGISRGAAGRRLTRIRI
ncbi:hypothetical protein [Streptomyces sp. NPDC127036]|uniref:hypothetical protein n=1 Tax=unclassified Streptomyces TaxID=2593676 RepID=UPI0036501E59